MALLLHSATVMNAGIHRIIEQHAAIDGDSLAIVDGDGHLTYRALNQQANALARQLLAFGFRRGSRAVVKMAPSGELAAVLLAILKAGGAYTLLDPATDATWPIGVAIDQGVRGCERQHVLLDLSGCHMRSAPAGPNLPVLTRGSDVACVLPGRDGLPAVLVPHATITALRALPFPAVSDWPADPGAIGMWLLLMSRATIVVSAHAATVAA